MTDPLPYFTFREWIGQAKSAEQTAIRTLWAHEQAYLACNLDARFIEAYFGRIYEQPVLVIHPHGYPNTVHVGDYLGCLVGYSPSVVRVTAMPTRKRLNLLIVDGPNQDHSFDWKRDLLLPFWPDGLQQRLF